MKNRVEDVAAVRGVINAYIEGSKGDAELLRSIFHSDAGMNGYFSGQLLIGSPEPFFAEVAKIDSSAPQGNYRAEIESIEVIGDVASATALVCVRCRTSFPVRDDIPVMLLDEATAGPRGIGTEIPAGEG